MIQFLEWDSSFFNKKVGTFECVGTNQSFVVDNDFDLIYIKQIDDKEVLFEKENFRLSHVETKVIFSKMISKINNLKDEFIISAFETSDYKQQLYELAFESGKFSRFNLDENFERSEFEALYRKWVDNSLSKEFADEVLLYKQGDAILGIITYKVNGNYATVGLLATKSESQGKGIGSRLVAAVESGLYEKGVEELRIPTQFQNEQACGFYTKMGYNVIEKIIIKHYWRL